MNIKHNGIEYVPLTEVIENHEKGIAWINALSKCSKALGMPDDQPLIEAPKVIEQLISDYDEAAADRQRLVRELDVLLNGKGGAAKQASLCDIVAQVRRMVSCPLGFIHTMHMEGGQTTNKVTDNRVHQWGEQGKNFSASYSVTSAPLFYLPKHDGLIGKPSSDWARCVTISDEPAVDEALRDFNADPTADSATCLVREVLKAVGQ